MISEWNGILAEANLEVARTSLDIISFCKFHHEFRNKSPYSYYENLYSNTAKRPFSLLLLRLCGAVPSSMIAFPICIYMKNYVTAKPNLNVIFSSKSWLSFLPLDAPFTSRMEMYSGPDYVAIYCYVSLCPTWIWILWKPRNTFFWVYSLFIIVPLYEHLISRICEWINERVSFLSVIIPNSHDLHSTIKKDSNPPVK